MKKNEVSLTDNFHGSFNAYHQYVSKYKIFGKYLQPFTRYSTNEKPEVPKCQMLAANILKRVFIVRTCFPDEAGLMYFNSQLINTRYGMGDGQFNSARS